MAKRTQPLRRRQTGTAKSSLHHRLCLNDLRRPAPLGCMRSYRQLPAPIHAQEPSVLRPVSVERSSVTLAVVPEKIAMGQSDVLRQFRSLAIESHAFLADTSQHRQSEWRRIGKGALMGMLLGVTAGLLIGQQENKKCDVACSMPAYRAVELGLLGSVLGAVVAAKWPHKE